MELNVKDLTDEELRTKLKELGSDVGPIVPSTRSVYEKKLNKLLGGVESPTLPIGSPAKTTLTDAIDTLTLNARDEDADCVSIVPGETADWSGNESDGGIDSSRILTPQEVQARKRRVRFADQNEWSNTVKKVLVITAATAVLIFSYFLLEQITPGTREEL